MSFAWPWCFLLLPLPWLLRRLLPPHDAGAALRVPSLPAMPEAAAPFRGQPAAWLAMLAWLLLVGAAARPQMPEDTRLQPVSGRDLMLAFDVSASMATADLRVEGQTATRLAAARRFADAFLARRVGDRVGLIVFGTQAYLHTPLTFDLDAVRAALAGADVGLAGRETALGDAIALAVKHLEQGAARERVLVLLSDGANTAGTLMPQRAAWLARRTDLRVHAVRIGGADAGADVETLKEVAQQSGGVYLRATDSVALAEFWQRIEVIEPHTQAGAALRPARELYPWPLAFSLLAAVWLTLFHRRTTTT